MRTKIYAFRAPARSTPVCFQRGCTKWRPFPAIETRLNLKHGTKCCETIQFKRQYRRRGKCVGIRNRIGSDGRRFSEKKLAVITGTVGCDVYAIFRGGHACRCREVVEKGRWRCRRLGNRHRETGKVVRVEVGEMPIQRETRAAHFRQRVDLRLRARVVPDIYLLYHPDNVVVAVVAAAPAIIEVNVRVAAVGRPAVAHHRMSRNRHLHRNAVRDVGGDARVVGGNPCSWRVPVGCVLRHHAIVRARTAALEGHVRENVRKHDKTGDGITHRLLHGTTQIVIRLPPPTVSAWIEVRHTNTDMVKVVVLKRIPIERDAPVEADRERRHNIVGVFKRVVEGVDAVHARGPAEMTKPLCGGGGDASARTAPAIVI